MRRKYARTFRFGCADTTEQYIDGELCCAECKECDQDRELIKGEYKVYNAWCKPCHSPVALISEKGTGRKRTCPYKIAEENQAGNWKYYKRLDIQDSIVSQTQKGELTCMKCNECKRVKDSQLKAIKSAECSALLTEVIDATNTDRRDERCPYQEFTGRWVED